MKTVLTRGLYCSEMIFTCSYSVLYQYMCNCSVDYANEHGGKYNTCLCVSPQTNDSHSRIRSNPHELTNKKKPLLDTQSRCVLPVTEIIKKKTFPNCSMHGNDHIGLPIDRFLPHPKSSPPRIKPIKIFQLHDEKWMAIWCFYGLWWSSVNQALPNQSSHQICYEATRHPSTMPPIKSPIVHRIKREVPPIAPSSNPPTIPHIPYFSPYPLSHFLPYLPVNLLPFHQSRGHSWKLWWDGTLTPVIAPFKLPLPSDLSSNLSSCVDYSVSLKSSPLVHLYEGKSLKRS